MHMSDYSGHVSKKAKSKGHGKKKSAKHERLIMKLKHEKGVDNPFALANYIMKKQG